jgi:fatty-acyl-CoA synthase
MRNSPEYMACWLGISRTGCIVSLINTHLTGVSLAHCVNVVRPQQLIVEAALIGSYQTAVPHLVSCPTVWVHGKSIPEWPRLELDVKDQLDLVDVCDVGISDTALYIYTSGTSGLPKPAKVSHYRLMNWTHWFSGLMELSPTDRMYNCLPMYHSVGGVVATGAVLVSGGSVLVKEKFSARAFWKDIVRWDCTLFQYIGELCRFLLNSGELEDQDRHHIRICCGNGLRGDIWQEFKDRFHIPRILEFYASTEGTFSLFNVEEKPGAIGRIPPFLAHRMTIRLLRFDFETNQPIRNDDGLCQLCGPDEVGEAVARLASSPGIGTAQFEGYAGESKSEDKILHDVLVRGDNWYRTGDLMRRDLQGYFYFVDRVGDTFRWKGENVATTEVSDAICSFPGVADAAVYGVKIPQSDGRAGMAAVVANEIDLAALHHHLEERLPSYARPVFLRICSQLDTTTTFKHQKRELVNEGYDPDRTADDIYFNDKAEKGFVRLDRTLFDRLQSGEIRT